MRHRARVPGRACGRCGRERSPPLVPFAARAPNGWLAATSITRHKTPAVTRGIRNAGTEGARMNRCGRVPPSLKHEQMTLLAGRARPGVRRRHPAPVPGDESGEACLVHQLSPLMPRHWGSGSRVAGPVRPPRAPGRARRGAGNRRSRFIAPSSVHAFQRSTSYARRFVPRDGWAPR